MEITPHLPQILQAISTNAVVEVEATTGSGKSIGIPAVIAAAGAKCFVTVPTREAAISLAEYQRAVQKASNPALDVNKMVGYAAEGYVHYSNETLIAYVTSGHMEEKLRSYFHQGIAAPIDFCDVIMVDEIHTRNIHSDVVVYLWMAAAQGQSTVPRLVIASATPSSMPIHPKPFQYKVDVPSFPIEYTYINADIDIDDPSGKLYTETAALTAKIHTETPISTGHILVFAPGSSEVETIVAYLKRHLSGKKAEVIAAFSALKHEDIAEIYKSVPSDTRKIIVATNIAETALTITDIGHVVDSMTEKRAESSLSGGFRLTLHYISKASARQRAGRTGRTRPGVCHRMCTLEKYESLEDHRPPEIDRIPIYDTVMKLLDVGLSPEVILQDVNPQRITNAIHLLTKLGMVTNVNNVVTVSESGHFVPNFPLSVRNAGFLWKWLQEGYPPFPGVVVAALIDCYGPSYFWIPRRTHEQSHSDFITFTKEYKEKYFGKYIGYNDLETSLNMWSDLTSTLGGINPQHRSLSNWVKNNSINNKKIRELLLVVNQSIKALQRLQVEVTIGPFTTEGVMSAARPLLLSTYSDLTLIQRRDFTYFSPITKDEYRLDNRDSVNKFAEKFPPGIIALVSAEIKGQRGIFRSVSFAVDTDKDGLGRPIVLRHRSRGDTRVISNSKPDTPVDSNIIDALNLLESLNLNTEVQPEPMQLPPLDATNYNPPLVIEHVEHNGKTFNLVQDSYLPVGTKQRGLNYFLALKEAGYTEVVTYATPFGYGQVAVAWCCAIAQLKCSLFLSHTENRTDMTEMAIGLGANVYEIKGEGRYGYTRNRELEEMATNYAAQNPTAIYIKLGLDDPVYIQYLAAAIQEAAGDIYPEVIWLAGGSFVIGRALALAFPGVHINVVQVGRDIFPDLLEGVNHTVYKAHEKFPDNALVLPPYTSLSNYDAKVWQFASQFGNTGDYIWNVK